jgi:outer membrane receptor protein involved in Fe transport
VDYIDLRALNGLLNFTDGRYTGFGLGDFMLGLSSQQGLTLYREADLYSDGWQLYGQDAWRLGGNLTFNYGLRYEYFTPTQDKANLMTNIEPSTGTIVTSTADGSLFERTLIHPRPQQFRAARRHRLEPEPEPRRPRRLTASSIRSTTATAARASWR